MMAPVTGPVSRRSVLTALPGERMKGVALRHVLSVAHGLTLMPAGPGDEAVDLPLTLPLSAG